MNTLLTTEPFYVVETPAPDTWIDPDLELFYHRARKFLADGAQPGELASRLDLEKELVRLNLGYLHRLGFVRLMNDQEATATRKQRSYDEVFDKGTKLLNLTEALPGAGVLIASYTYYFWFC